MSDGLISQVSLAEFKARFDRYAMLTSKGRKEAVLHQSRNFSFFLLREMKAKAYKKGQIKSLVIGRLRSFKPVKISERARKVTASRGGNNPMATEMKLRDARRMYTASASKFKGPKDSESFAVSNGQKQIGRLKHTEVGNQSGAEFEWGGKLNRWSKMAATGLSSASRRGGFEKAIRETSRDMLLYITKKQNQIGRSIARGL